MKLGTKSLLFGAHQFILHGCLVAYAWYLIYGFPYDPRLWFCFFFHDIGYWGSPDMDGAQTGKLHPYRGARWASFLFDSHRTYGHNYYLMAPPKWFWFSLLHSSSTAKALSMKPSKLCWPDKLATLLVPKKLYLFLVRLTGEIEEYKADMSPTATDNEWYDYMCCRMAEKLRANLTRVEQGRIKKYLDRHPGPC